MPEPAPTRRRHNWGFTLTYVVLLGAVGGGGVYALAVADDDSDGEDGPERAVRDYLTAQATHDCEGGVDLLSERLVEDAGGRQEMIDDCADDENEAGDTPSDEDLDTMLGTVETEDVEGDRATVTYQAELRGELDPATVEFSLVRESDAWKVDDLVPVTGDLPEDSPQVAARDQAQAVLDQDCEAFLGVLTEEAQAELGSTPEDQLEQCEQWLSNPPGEDATLGTIFRESDDGDTAEVGVTIMSEGYEAGANVFYVTVVREDGEWKVDQAEWSDAPGEDT